MGTKLVLVSGLKGRYRKSSVKPLPLKLAPLSHISPPFRGRKLMSPQFLLTPHPFSVIRGSQWG